MAVLEKVVGAYCLQTVAGQAGWVLAEQGLVNEEPRRQDYFKTIKLTFKVGGVVDLPTW